MNRLIQVSSATARYAAWGGMKLWAAGLSLCLLLAPVQAQPPYLQPARVGLALSGGGAKGLAHIGVLKVLDEAGIPVDLVVGTSMGSVVGVLYAGGYSAREIEALALDIDWDAVLQDRPGRRRLSMEEKLWDGRYAISIPLRGRQVQLPRGLKSGQKLTAVLTSLLAGARGIDDFDDLPIPFACVATDFQEGHAVRLEQGDLVTALRASMALPGIFIPIRYGGRWLIDGGVVRNLPAQDAREMGADFVIGVDLSRGLESADSLSLVGILNQSLRIPRKPLHQSQQEMVNLLIRPKVNDFGVLDFSRIEAIIARGEEAAREVLPRLQELATPAPPLEASAARQPSSSFGGPAPSHRPSFEPTQPALPEKIWVVEVALRGLSEVDREMVSDALPSHLPAEISLREINRAIERVYATHLFEQVTYRLESVPGGKRLALQLTEKPRRTIGAGFRYDSYSRLSVLLNATYRSARRRYPSLSFDAEIGNRMAFRAQHFRKLGHRVGLRSQASITQLTSTYRDGYDRPAELRFSTASASSFLSRSHRNLLYGIGVEMRHRRIVPTMAPMDLKRSHETQLRFKSLIWYDNLDRAFFPRRGHHLFYESSSYRQYWKSRSSGIEHRFDWRAAAPLDSRLSLVTEVQFYSTTSLGRKDPLLPESEKPYVPLLKIGALLGGNDTALLETGRFVGLARNEHSGKHMKALMAGVQTILRPDIYALLRVNVGHTFDRWTWNLGDAPYVFGAGVTVAKITNYGPISVTLGTSNRRPLLLDVNLGITF